MTSETCLLRILLLWALLCPGRGNGVQEEIFTRPGSDLLLPIRLHLTLNHTDRLKCDGYDWKYKDPPTHNDTRIFGHKRCKLSNNEYILFPNIRISENGSLIISDVTLENDGRYSVDIYKAGHNKRTDNYTIHVEVPVSVPLLHVSCLRNGSAEISCRVEEGTNPNIHLSVIGGSQEKYSTSANNITAIVGSPGPWNITCTVKNGVSRSEESRAGVTCPVPLSDITVNSSCLTNGSAVAVCSVKGSDPHYSWSLDGRSVSSHSRVTLPPPVSGILRCDVTNEINNLSGSINIFCPVPVSDPILNVGCLQNGSAEISCEVKNGTDLSIYLIVSGELEVYNVTSSERTVRVTVPPVPPPESWNISCSVKNDISEKITNQTHGICTRNNVQEKIFTRPGSDLLLPIRYNLTLNHPDRERCDRIVWYYEKSPGSLEEIAVHRNCNLSDRRYFPNTRISENGSLIISNVTLENNGTYSVYIENSTRVYIQRDYYNVHVEDCLSCLRNALIGGFVALLVTMPPIFIAHWYILRGIRRNHRPSPHKTRRNNPSSMMRKQRRTST